jgi:hypothetical protein
MIELLNSSELRDVLYGVATIFALLGWTRERADLAASPDPSRQPMFWLLSAALLAAMGISRAIDLGDAVSDLGRDGAASQGWYDTRFLFQEVVVVALATIWGLSIFAGARGARTGRGRYLPTAAMLTSLIGFAVVRLVSLHQIDALLYRRDLLGLRIVSLLEVTLLTGTIATMLWFPLDSPHRESGKG